MNIVKDFQNGELPPPKELKKLKQPRISNWASHKGLAQKYPWGISFDDAKHPDWFFEDKNLFDGVVIIDHWG